MSHNDATFPLSPPSWTWDQTPTDASEAPADSAPKTESRKRRCVSSWAELPSRRWLVQASRKH
ncbi:MAG: hypothetical protein QGH60_03770 [Phycisphaerae bacterium]|nr:hypothetical protein [Phycisphaerae bacterium]